MRLPVKRMRRMRRAFATLQEELRTMAEERKHFHLVDKFFAPTETEAYFNGERAGLLHDLVKASIVDEGRKFSEVNRSLCWCTFCATTLCI